VIKADTVVVFQSKDSRPRLESAGANRDMHEVLRSSDQDPGQQQHPTLPDHVQIDPHITMHMLSPAGIKQAYQPRYSNDAGQMVGEECQGEYPQAAPSAQTVPLGDQMDAIERHTNDILKKQGLRPTPQQRVKSALTTSNAGVSGRRNLVQRNSMRKVARA